CEQCAGRHRPIGGALEREAVSGDPAHEPTYQFSSVGRWSVLCPGRGKATAEETTSPKGSATGFSVASGEAPSLWRDAVVVITLIRSRSRHRGPAVFGPSLRSSRWLYARTKPFLWTITSPSVIFGGFGSAVSSFSSRTQLAATRVDSSAWAELSNRPIELMTPLPASMR